MQWTIGEVSERVGMPSSTIRYYEKHGLLPGISRDENGNRTFDERDEILLRVVADMKKCGMPLKQIRHFAELFCQGDANNYAERVELLESWRQELETRIEDMHRMHEVLLFYCWYNREATQTDSVADLRAMTQAGIPEEMRTLNEKYNLIVPF